MKTESWREQAECRGMDTSVFILSNGKRGRPIASDYAKAKAICMACSVRLHCLNFALENNFNEFGMFGGTSPRARQEILRNKRKASGS
jgi:WhiB family redox-sensing transcriptional regulator